MKVIGSLIALVHRQRRRESPSGDRLFGLYLDYASGSTSNVWAVVSVGTGVVASMCVGFYNVMEASIWNLTVASYAAG